MPARQPEFRVRRLHPTQPADQDREDDAGEQAGAATVEHRHEQRHGREGDREHVASRRTQRLDRKRGGERVGDQESDPGRGKAQDENQDDAAEVAALDRDQAPAPERDPQERHREPENQRRRQRRAKKDQTALAAGHLPQQTHRVRVDLVALSHDDLTGPNLVEHRSDVLRRGVAPILGLVQVQVDVGRQVDHQEVDDRCPLGPRPPVPAADLRLQVALHFDRIAAIAEEVDLDRLLASLHVVQRDALQAVLEQRFLVLHDSGPQQQTHQAGQAFLQFRATVLAARAGRQQVRMALIDPQAAPDPQPSQPLLGHVLFGQELGHLVEPPLDREQVRDPPLDFVGLNGVEIVERADVGAGPAAAVPPRSPRRAAVRPGSHGSRGSRCLQRPDPAGRRPPAAP